MRGDKLIIQEEHIKATEHAMKLILPRILRTQKRFIISIAGESGTGKSEIAAVLSELLSKEGIKSIIIQQDDYFVYPPRTNDRMRRKDIRHVGPSEVRLTLLDENLKDIKEGENEIEKPLVIYDDDLITKENAKLAGIKVTIVEGTYTTLLENVHQRIFIDRTYVDTREARRRRGREEQDEYLERVLSTEHGIISQHKARADIIVTKDYGTGEATCHGSTAK